MFLGTSPMRLQGELLESVLFNLNICLFYFLSIEKYIESDKLNKLYKCITDPNFKKIEIDEDIIKSISISLN
jgi:hypothetical protein